MVTTRHTFCCHQNHNKVVGGNEEEPSFEIIGLQGIKYEANKKEVDGMS